MIIDSILKGITQEEEHRERTSPLRMSSSGKCQRAIAYQLFGYEADPLSSRAILVFRLGDTIEQEIKELLIKYPPEGHVLKFDTDPIELEIDGEKITGHIDGEILGETNRILEIKSINAARFRFLDNEGIPYDYKCQATCYMKAKNYSETLFVFYNKDTSHIKEMHYKFDEKIWQEVSARFKNVITSDKENLPTREFAPNEKSKLPWQCSYCSYNKHCWPEAKLVFDSKNKPSLIIERDAA